MNALLTQVVLSVHLLVLGCAGAAHAAEAGKPVDELLVTAPRKCLDTDIDFAAPRPQVVSTFPARGATVRPGLLVIRITFDRAMTCRGFLAAIPPSRSPCPEDLQKLVLSFDHRTVRILCGVVGESDYALSVGIAPDQQFVSVRGRPMAPYELRFRTSGGPPVATVPEALAQDAAAPAGGGP